MTEAARHLLETVRAPSDVDKREVLAVTLREATRVSHPAPPGRYRTALKKQKIDDARIARLRKDATETRRYEPARAPGPKATLAFTLVTDRTRVSVPFEFKNVPLP